MRTKRLIILQCLLCFAISFASKAASKQPPLPGAVAGVHNYRLLLNGTWQFDPQPQKSMEKSSYKPKGGWSTIVVPGECAMQGFAIEHDKPVLYRKSFSIPADFAGKQVILRFDGVYSYARLFVNGTFIREHHGGFTRWESDVTTYLKPGKNNEIKLEVTDRKDDISYASGYAHHPIGGILRDVLIYALPKNHIDNFRVETVLDKNYTHASLNVALSLQHTKAMQVKFTLLDPKGKAISLSNSSVEIPFGTDTLTHRMRVSNPEKWDAEHPNLYTLRTSCVENGKEIYSFTRQIGFRDIIIKENQLFVNGQPVKLRGACRHDMHPTLGRTTTAEYDSLDAVLFKKSNMNFVRTSHYPPTERFLEYCDKMGLYVECETAICFVDTHRQKNYG
ncbi:MAG: beta-galactosidase, partial [Porphyromonadaceae bacterium]|nr:beta-galactosidase [Porphyromonadaceae bacterium]